MGTALPGLGLQTSTSKATPASGHPAPPPQAPWRPGFRRRRLCEKTEADKFAVFLVQGRISESHTLPSLTPCNCGPDSVLTEGASHRRVNALGGEGLSGTGGRALPPPGPGCCHIGGCGSPWCPGGPAGGDRTRPGCPAADKGNKRWGGGGTWKYLKSTESRVRGKTDGLNFPAITGRRVGEALIDEAFKPPMSRHPPRYKRPQTGLGGRAVDGGWPRHETQERPPAFEPLSCGCPVTTFDGHFPTSVSLEMSGLLMRPDPSARGFTGGATCPVCSVRFSSLP